MDNTELKPTATQKWDSTRMYKNFAYQYINADKEGRNPFKISSNENTITPPVIINARRGFVPPMNQYFPLVMTAAEKGYKSGVVVDKAFIEQLGTKLKEGERGTPYAFKDKFGFNHGAYLFFAEQTENPEKILAVAKENAKPLVLKGQTIKVDKPENYYASFYAAAMVGAALEASSLVNREADLMMSKVIGNESRRGLSSYTKEIPTLAHALTEAGQKGFEIADAKKQELGVGKYNPEKQQKREEYKKAIER